MYRAVLDPTKGSEQAGTRPVLVVSRDAINQNSPVVIVVPISDRSNFKRLYPSQLELRKGVAGLTMDSVAMCEQVRAICVDRLKDHLGRLQDDLMDDVNEKLKIALDL